jgi:hypothetical protein
VPTGAAGFAVFFLNAPNRPPGVGDGLAAVAGALAGEADALAFFLVRLVGEAVAAGLAAVPGLGLGLAAFLALFFGLGDAAAPVAGVGVAFWASASGRAAIAAKARSERNLRINAVVTCFCRGGQSWKLEKPHFLVTRLSVLA